MATNDFDEAELFRLGFLVKETTSEYILLRQKGSENEIIVWKLGDWLQFRCSLYDFGTGAGSREYIALSETINRMHDLALGARVSLSDTGEVTMVADVLHSTVTNDVAATTCKQVLYLAEMLLDPIEEIVQGKSALSVKEIDDLFPP